MQFRVEAEALNALNHTQFGGPDTNNQAGSSFGAITSTGVSAQQVEDFKPPLATAILTSDSPPGLSDFFGPAGAKPLASLSAVGPPASSAPTSDTPP